MRLRQVVLAAREPEPVVAALRAELGAGDPYADPGVATFGLRNAVMALGDTFVEVVSPVVADSPAGRWLDRRDAQSGGYMLMFQVDEPAEATRARAARLGVRVAWRIDLPDISGTHLHPKDTGGTLISIDRADPPASWRWAGPAWTGTAPARRGAGGLLRATVATPEPERAAARWAELLGTTPAAVPVEWTAGDDAIRAVDVRVAPKLARGAAIEIAGVSFRRS